MSHNRMCLQLVLLLATASGILCQSSTYYGYLGYSYFPAQVLQNTNDTISLYFKFCETDGILLYATSGDSIRYLAIGVYRSRILVEFYLSTIEDVQEILQSTELVSNTWYNVTFLNLNRGNKEFHLYVNGEDTQVSSSPFTSANLSVLDGTLYVGGHPSPRHIEPNRLRCTLDICMQSFMVGNDEIDLSSSAQDISSGCPTDHCQIKTKTTFSSPSSYLSFPIEERTTSFIKLQLDFQTSVPDGLLAVTGSSMSDTLMAYLSDGHVSVLFASEGDEVPASIITSTDIYNDSLMHHLRIIFDDGAIRMIVDGADRQSTEVIVHTFSQPNRLWFGTIVQDNFTLPSDVPITSATACLYNMAYSNTGQLQLFDPQYSNMSQSVVYDACIPTLACPGVCDLISEECYFLCICTDGFEGEGGACQEIDECEPNPCENGATCINKINDYECLCTEEFNKGKNCDIANSCVPNPCQNNGLCFDYEYNYLCNCTTGWSGINCTINADDCELDSCMNGGTCIDLLDDFECSCEPGYAGNICEEDIDECAALPCENGATCEDLINAYQCTCAPGYTGGTCAEEINECLPNPCLHGGSCTDGLGNFTCSCPPTYTGSTCDLDVDECLGDPCYHGGTCINREDGFDCQCAPGFTGPLCIGDILECSLYQPCHNGGICQEKEEGGYECLCPNGWIGENCTESFDDCWSQPCLNGAECIDGHLSVTCDCPIGYTGSFCEIVINECEPNPCMNNAICIDLIGEFFCWCLTNFTGDLCEIELGTCDVAPCQNNATCINTEDGYVCECADGYTGTNCDAEIDDCTPNPCQNNATCTDKMNDFECDCPDGYEGKACDVNIDDCTPNPCLFDSPCIDQLNGYKCDCPNGLIGLKCEVSLKECVTEPCHNGATCEELDIGYNCACAAGFTGSNCQSDINECLDTPCQYGGNCTNSFGGYSCSCPIGTMGDNCQVNIDDCASDPCEDGATCEDQLNAYICVCPLGYTGMNCSTEINECLSSPCQNKGECIDLEGTYKCNCLPTFTGPSCNVPLDICASLNPCKNGGQCIELTNVSSDSILDYYTCQCSIGYTDQNCSTNIDDCSPSPCLNDGKCTDTLNDYVCSCPDGLTGRNCQDLDTFTVTSDDGYISLPSLPSDFNQLYITMFFATTVPSGVILYQGGLLSSDYLGDFLSLVLRNGVLLITYEAGGGLNDEKSIKLGESLNDGNFHHLSLSLQMDKVICLVDFNNCTSGISCYGEIPVSDPIEFGGPLYIGGINGNEVPSNATEFHLDDTISLISTIKDLRINDTAIEYGSVVDSVNVGLGLVQSVLCDPNPCANGGQCIDRWTSFACVCPNGYGDPVCNTLRTAHLNGKTIIEFDAVSSATIRFDFTINSDGLLMRTIESQEKDQLIAYLDDRFLIIEVVTGEISTRHYNIQVEQLNDGEWYDCSMVLSNDSIIVTVVGEGSVCSTPCISEIVLPDNSELHFEFPGQVSFGDVSVLLSQAIINQLLQTNGVVGCVQDLSFTSGETILSLDDGFNDTNPAEPGCPRDSKCPTNYCANDGVCKSGWSGYTCDCTPDYDGSNCTNDISYTLSGDTSYIRVSINSLLLDLSDRGMLSFRTIDTSAILLYAAWYNNHVSTDDYLILEIVQGYIQFSTYISEEHRSLNHSVYVSDGEWHMVQWSVMPQSANHTSLSVTVDGSAMAVSVPLPYTRATNDLIDIFIGGTEDPQTLPDAVSESKSYFRGCVSSLYLDDAMVSLVSNTPAIDVSRYNAGQGCSLLQSCSAQPCPSNATCTNMFDSYSCICPSGYTGADCDVEISVCLDFTCEHNGTCIDSMGSFYCECRPGYNGSYCENVINPCDDVPCDNGGICSHTGDLDFACSCLSGYTGDTCSTEVDECSSNPCLNNGTCTDLLNDYNCSCLPGYSGTNCHMNIDDCYPNACANGGQCIDGIDSFTCKCPLGFTGPQCKTNVDDCASMPCANGATCIDGINSYQCLCPNEFITGTDCDTILPPCDLDPCQNGGNCSEIDSTSVSFSGFSSGDYPPLWSYECDCPPEYFGTNCEMLNYCYPDPCLNNATCDSVVDSFICTCSGDYTGLLCDSKINPCELLPDDYCNNGTCVNEGNSMYCQCNEGYSGSKCEFDIICSLNPCQNGGSCIDQIDGYLCICPSGYTGDDCEENIGNCSPDPCQSGGSCIDQIDSYLCICPSGYTGDDCEENIDDCSPDPCQNGGSCIGLVNDYQCICAPGYTDANCETDIDDCSESPCMNQGTCIDEVNGFTCVCPDGITGSLCDSIISLCDFSPCQNGATCVTTDYFIGSGSDEEQLFSCICPNAYTGLLCDVPLVLCSVPCLNGGVCVDDGDGPYCDCPGGLSGEDCSVDDVNDCEPNPCINGNCTDLFMGYQCTCEAYYTGDNCSVSTNPCQPSPCQNSGSCTEYNGTFDCDCLTGFTGSLCQDIDFCMLDGYPCDNSATCINNQTSMVAVCVCPPGFTGKHCSVSSNDPCEDNLCLNNGTCIFQSADDYECNCTEGYSGINCEDVDECIIYSPCLNGASCLDSETGYMCVCAPGYTGALCEEGINRCADDPCMNGATCLSWDNDQLLTPETFICLCPPYYTGELCDAYVHPCADVVCYNDGECAIDDGINAVCVCPNNYTGAFCETPISPCQPNPCRNGGTCIEEYLYISGSGSNDVLTPEGDYMCVCPTGFTGFVCDVEVDVCMFDNPCMNGATCSSDNDQATCTCPIGYSGNVCSEDIDECINVTCSGVGTCIESSTNITDILPPGEQLDPDNLPIHGDFLCLCPVAYSGDLCEMADFCYSSPCNNNGTCISNSNNGTFTCNCTPGYSGDTCTNDTDECSNSPCMNNGICIESSSTLEGLIEQGLPDDITPPLVPIGEFACICNDAFVGNLCEIPSANCSEAPCQNGGTCMEDEIGFKCVCVPGYTDILCDTDINECADSPCLNGGICIDSNTNSSDTLPPPPGEYQCLCLEDYVGDLCQYSNPCAEPSLCVNGNCSSDNIGNYSCSCFEGYAGDDCNTTTPCFDNPCDNGGICIDSYMTMEQLMLLSLNVSDIVVTDEEEFVCICGPEYTGDMCEVMVDPCAMMSPCDNGGICINTGGNSFECICLSGYTGNDCGIDIDYCESVLCDNGGTCFSDKDGFSCICLIGYTGDLCSEDINECINITCSGVGTCIESSTNITDILPHGEQLDSDNLHVPAPGDFLCLCPIAYSGDFCEMADFCYSSPCNNNGMCISNSDNDTFTCICAPGYSGDTCTNDTDECSNDPCMNNGICIESSSTPDSFKQEYQLPSNFSIPVVPAGEFICICDSLYFGGETCEEPLLNCSHNPCSNGGTCDPDDVLGFICTCPVGLTGISCTIDVNECEDNVCANNGTCIESGTDTSLLDSLLVTPPSLGDFICLCSDKFIGDLCQLSNPCAEPSLCVNGNCSSDNVGNYSCSCFKGYAGDDCNTTTPCFDDPCDNGGICIDSSVTMEQLLSLNLSDILVTDEDEFVCLCDPEYTGDMCEVMVDPCAMSPCDNGGICVNIGENSFECICSSGYTGDDCGIEISYCESVLCDNGGTCVSDKDGFSCICPFGYTGDLCSKDINECINITCSGVGTCIESSTNITDILPPGEQLDPDNLPDVPSPGDFFCLCPVAYSGDLCEMADFCYSSPCNNNGTCISNSDNGTFTCNCAPGYSGDTCTNDTDECNNSPCMNNGICVESSSTLEGLVEQGLPDDITPPLVPIGEFACICNDAFVGNLCETPSTNCSKTPCQNGGTCVKDEIGFKCVCVPGYTDILCDTDIDECADSPCLNGGICINSNTNSSDTLPPPPGEYQCLCLEDYVGDLCQYSNPCAEPSVCVNGNCVSDNVGNYSCSCFEGYAGDDCNTTTPCFDNPCDNGGICIDSYVTLEQLLLLNLSDIVVTDEDEFVCICGPEYTGDMCEVMVDPCAMMSPCDNGGTCINIGGNSFECICPIGYTGGLCSEDINECINITCSGVGTCIESSTNITDILPPGEHLDPDNLPDVPSPGDFFCLCPVAYSGDLCEMADFCYSSPCNNDGTCISNSDNGTFTCICAPGYSGDTCTNDIDECNNSPCMNNGICIESSSTLEGLIEQGLPDDITPPLVPIGEFACICNDAFVGNLCETPSANCSEAPCQNGGTCMEDEIGFKCVCVPGYTDILCDTDIDECADSPCLNGGICIDSNTNSSDTLPPPPGEYQCLCLEDYVGDLCQYSNPCAEPSVCVNGNCSSDNVGNYSCSCFEGYAGDDCNTTTPCFDNPCNNGGICIDSYMTMEQLALLSLNVSDIVVTEDEFVCICGPEYTGDMCEVMVDPCAMMSPCDNEGTCINIGGNSFECICPIGYSGNVCSEDIDECINVTCSGVGTCIESSTNITDILPPGEQLDPDNLPAPGDFLCLCPVTYSGDLCEMTDFCYSSPCNNNGTCISNSDNDTFTCICAPGYSGDTCTNDTDECSNSPCMNNGICIESSTNITELLMQIPIPEIPENPALGEFLCLCPPSFTGDVCETFNSCFFALCGNGATCISHSNGTFTCTCVPGYSGDTCDIDTDECSSDPCTNNGICIESSSTPESLIKQGHQLPSNFSIPEVPAGEFICICDSMYFGGETCEEPLLNCSHNPCSNGGTCDPDDVLGFICTCPVGLTGMSCTIDVNECEGNVCANNGTCIESGTDTSLLDSLLVTPPSLGDFICLCSDKFIGDLCQYSNPCAEPSLCVNGNCSNDNVGNYNCSCFEGYTGDICNTTVPCFNDPCDNGGTCINSYVTMEQLLSLNISIPAEGEFVCNCGPEYTGDTCEIMIDPCVMLLPCDNGGTCNNTGGNTFECTCPLGYTGGDCSVNIDDCDPNSCVNGNCTDEVNDYMCTCFPGYTGDSCETHVCALQLGPCRNGGTCLSTPDGYYCECPDSYTGDECDTDVDECLDTANCINGTCENLVGSYSCSCYPGYTGEHCDTDINECEAFPGICENGDCENLRGGYNCTCTEGFSGKNCTEDIDECAQLLNICNNGTCDNTVGSYTCNCDDGYMGPNCTTVLEVERPLTVTVGVPVAVAVVIAITLLLVLFVIVLVVGRKRRRKRHGSYSPAAVEHSNVEPDMTDLKRQRERLI